MSHPHPCLVCGIATFFWCSRCRNAWYCSSGHSHGDWKNHRKECHPALAYRLNMIAMPPPAESQYLSVEAICFLVNEGASCRSTLHLRLPRPERPKICTIYHITSGAVPKPWYGNAIVLKFNDARRQGYTDAGSNDLPALSAYFLSLSDQ
ncbi:hypothetical protein B0H14DRAFT_3083081 [Mycena olivaceomarginata]|nr:hypothetical protein B0H14DRAFT_3083081 [Mycena olivaceomarginata]